jgi:hypothetical protein
MLEVLAKVSIGLERVLILMMMHMCRGSEEHLEVQQLVMEKGAKL